MKIEKYFEERYPGLEEGVKNVARTIRETAKFELREDRKLGRVVGQRRYPSRFLQTHNIRGKTVGLSITPELVEKGAVSLVGREITSVRDLPTLYDITCMKSFRLLNMKRQLPVRKLIRIWRGLS